MSLVLRRAALAAALLAGVVQAAPARAAETKPAPASPPAGAPPAAAAQPGQPIPINLQPMPAGTADDSWKTATELNKVDFTGLSPEQKDAALKFMRDESCTCGCPMKIAECRVKDKNCPTSPGLAANVVKLVKEGKTGDALKTAFMAAIPPRPTPPPPPPTIEATKVDIPLEGAPVKGPKTAKVTLTEFSDFQCPFCAGATAWVDQIAGAYPNDVKVVFKQYPLPFHQNAKISAQAALAAHAQGKFWLMHDKLFANSKTLSKDNIMGWAKEIGLNMEQFTKDLESDKTKAAVEKDIADGSKVGVQGTPSFFVNGKRYNGGRDLASIKPIIDNEIKGGGAAAAPVKPAGAAAKPAGAEAKPKTLAVKPAGATAPAAGSPAPANP